MSVETIKKVAELMRAARVEGAVNDPDYFEKKASTWDAIAQEDPHIAADAKLFAEEARLTAKEIREKIQGDARDRADVVAVARSMVMPSADESAYDHDPWADYFPHDHCKVVIRTTSKDGGDAGEERGPDSAVESTAPGKVETELAGDGVTPLKETASPAGEVNNDGGHS